MHKLSAIVQLLLGAIPERTFFREPASKGPMRPYLKLVQAVRLGELSAFRAAMEEHAQVFTADGNMTLVMRLRQNVIRAGAPAASPPPPTPPPSPSLSPSPSAPPQLTPTHTTTTHHRPPPPLTHHHHSPTTTATHPPPPSTAAGLRNISLSYSRISLSEVAQKLALDHPEDMESIAAKAIRDGVLDATIDHATGTLVSKEQVGGSKEV